MQIRFYPYDFEYKIVDQIVYVCLYSKLENGQKVCVLHPYRPYFFAEYNIIDHQAVEEKLRSAHLPAKPEPAQAVSWEIVEKEYLGQKKQFWKVYVNYPRAVPIISQLLEAAGVNCYEKDILFVHRYLRDNSITPMTLVQAEGQFSTDQDLRVPMFRAETVQQYSKDVLTTWKILAFDIETYAVSKEIDPQRNPILMIALYGIDEAGTEFKKVITWKKFTHQLNYLEVVEDEMELLQRFRALLLEYQPEILTGYYSDGFDLPYLEARAKKHHLPLDLGLDHSSLKIKAQGITEVALSGYLHLDMLKFIKSILRVSLKTDTFTLDAVSSELLGSKKEVVNLDELAHVWDHEPDKLPDFCSYNLHDAHLTLKLCQRLLPDILEFTKIIGLPSADVIRMRFSRLVENYILKRAIEYNVIAPNKPINAEIEERQEESIQGAFVYEPTPGLYQDVVVFDFRSLYPTIISAHNIGPESLHCSCCRDKKVPELPEYWFCEKNKKFIPTVLEQLILRRADLKRLIKESKAQGEDTKILEARSLAIKTLANSFYGYLGFYGARWYCLECAASTTAYARNYIKTTIKKAESKGFQVIYADTDSCFMLLGDKILDEALQFMNEINFDLPGHMELEFEGYYPRGLFVAIKGTLPGGQKLPIGAKKKYALIDKNGRMKITGFETVRRNWSLLAKQVQEEILKLVLQDKKEEALQYFQETVKQLKAGEIESYQLLLKTQITRALASYSSVGPHVFVARKMEERGQKIVPGMSVQYIIIKGSGLVRERAQLPELVKEGQYDADYYLYHQLLPSILPIFEVVGYTEEELLGQSKQTGLGKFF